MLRGELESCWGVAVYKTEACKEETAACGLPLVTAAVRNLPGNHLQSASHTKGAELSAVREIKFHMPRTPLDSVYLPSSNMKAPLQTESTLPMTVAWGPSCHFHYDYLPSP